MKSSRSALGTKAMRIAGCAAHVHLVAVLCGDDDAKRRGARELKLGLGRRDIGRDAGAEQYRYWGRFARLARRGKWRVGRAARLVVM